jgi:hypothetical protein
MRKDIEKISVDQFESALADDGIITEKLSGTEDVMIQIKKCLPLDEMLAFVQEVVESCIDVETGEYTPEAYEFAIRVGVLTHYANFTMPDNVERQYFLIYNTHAFKQVLNRIDESQFNDIIHIIGKKINFMLDVISSTAVSKINEVISKLGDIAKASESMFNGLNSEEIAKAVRGISKFKDMSESDLAKTILNSQSTTGSETAEKET